MLAVAAEEQVIRHKPLYIRIGRGDAAYLVASFPGPAQLFIACSVEERGTFSHMSMT